MQKFGQTLQFRNDYKRFWLPRVRLAVEGADWLDDSTVRVHIAIQDSRGKTVVEDGEPAHYSLVALYRGSVLFKGVRSKQTSKFGGGAEALTITDGSFWKRFYAVTVDGERTGLITFQCTSVEPEDVKVYILTDSGWKPENEPEPAAKPQSSQPKPTSRTPMQRDLSRVRFESTDHIRYQNGRDVSGHNEGAKRGIEIKPNIWGGEGYTVTIYNQDGNHPLWGDNVQMAPKQMRVVKQDQSKVELRGFGHDPMGEPFSDYGVTVHFAGDAVEKIVLHMHDRNIDIEYLR